MTHKILLVPALLLAGLMLGPSPAQAEVRDEGKFFSTEAVKKANARLKILQEKTKKELRIDTFDRVPDPQRKDFEEAKQQKKTNDFLHTWARSRARDLSIKGVYVLLCKEAGFQVEVSDSVRNQFTLSDREKMVDAMRKIDPKSESNDAVLESAVSLVEEKFRADSTSTGTTTPVTRKKQESNPILGWICIALVVLLGIWLVVGVVRALSGGGGGGYGGGGGGGGSFFGGLLAGMFGAAAGYWLYSNFFGGSTSSALGGSPDAGGGTASGPDDYSGTGGTWGDSGGSGGGGTWGNSDAGGGGDWGGGDAGGGDWGGGDAGGGDW